MLAVVFGFAAGAKLADRPATADGFARLGLPWPRPLAVLVPAVELVTAVLLVALPLDGAIAALGLLMAFTGLLVHRLRAGDAVPCRCFGQVATRPISWRHVGRNGALAALAVVVLAAPPA